MATSNRPRFLAELKRRNVLRAAVLYIGAVWAISQGISQLTPAIGLPDLATRWFLIAAAIGFPLWVTFAWFYELTPGGLKRESDIAQDESVVHATGRKLDKWIITVLTIAVVLLLTNTFVWHKGAGLSGGAAAIPEKSVAVLPFQNLSGGPNEKYFSDGITEEILNTLAQVSNLKVTGRTSAFQFRSKQGDPRKIGEALGVANLLEGSVQKAGDVVRINVQLIDARTGYQRWSEKYDRKLTNIFAIEDDISSAIAGKLRVQLTGAASQALVAQKVIDPRAHDFYLRGLTLLAVRGPGLRDAVAAFQNAVKIAPDYAQAWGALAEAQALYPDYDLGTMQAAYASALSYAQHALSLDPDLASAYVAQGMVYKNQWRWAEGDAAFLRALALAPGDAEAANQHAQFLLVIGQFKPALAEIERAQRLDPLSPSIGDTRAYLLMILRRYDAAWTQLQRTIAAHPDYEPARSDAIDNAVFRHDYAEADRQARMLAVILGHDPEALSALVRGISDPAQRTGAVQSLETAPVFAGLRSDPLLYATWLADLGAYDRALAVIERFAVLRNSTAPEVMWDHTFDPIRNDPRFKAVLKKMGLPYVPLKTKAQ